MKTILVPTDFSKLSKVAASYAIGLAKKMNARIILLSVINASSSSTTLMNWRKLEEKMIKAAQRDAGRLMYEIKSTGTKVPVSCQSVLGFPTEEVIDQFAVEKNVDFIVIGSKGATGLKKVFIGSNAAAVIDNSSVPVIVVPGKTDFRQIKKLVYATDMQNLHKEVKTLARFAGPLGAHIHVLHITSEGSSKKNIEKLARAELSNADELAKKGKYPKIHLHVLKNGNVADGVNKFVIDQKADLLAMFTHRLDFYEKLFGKSVTRQLAFHTHIPLLAFNRTNR